MKKLITILIIFLLNFSILADENISVLSFNVWGTSNSDNKDHRIWTISRILPYTLADIIILQEVWDDDDKIKMIKMLKKHDYQYSAWKNPSRGLSFKGLKGNGLLIISKFPLDQNIKTIPFSKITRYWEYFLNKGILKTRVKLPKIGWVDLFAAHLGAFDTITEDNHEEKTAKELNTKQVRIQSLQAIELEKFIVNNRSSETYIIGADLNAHYFHFSNGKYLTDQLSLVYKRLVDTDSKDGVVPFYVIDTYAKIHGIATDPKKERPYTYDTSKNKFAKSGKYAYEPSGVLDYIMINNENQLEIVDSKVVFNSDYFEDYLNISEIVLSDHYGVLTNFKIVDY